MTNLTGFLVRSLPFVLTILVIGGCAEEPAQGNQGELAQPAEPENKAPVALTTGTLEAVAGKTVTLDAAQSADPDGDALTYAWTQSSGTTVTLDDPASATATFTAPMEVTTLTFQLVVSDDEDSASAESTVFISNEAPIAVVAAPETVEGGAEVKLDASGSSDPDGHEVTWKWTQTAGDPVALSDDTSATPTFTAQATKGTVAFQVLVSDGIEEGTPATVVVAIANHPPVAAAGADSDVAGGVIVTLDGSESSDEDGDALTYQWVHLADEAQATLIITGSDTATPSFVAPIAKGQIKLRLVVNDGEADSQADDVVVSVLNNAPVANAGEPQVVGSGAVIKLAGSATDADNDPLTYAWTQLAGPETQLSGADTAEPTFTAPAGPAVLEFQLIASDGELESAPATVQISVDNTPPVADAGQHQAVDAAAAVTLDGSKSTDADGDALTYTWTQVLGPETELSDATASAPTFTAPAEKAALVFQLIVNDGTVDSAPAVVQIHVDNQPPTADAGDDQQLKGGTAAVIDGSGSSDPDGQPLTYEWTQTAGTPVEFVNDGATISFDTPTTRVELVFELTVSDGFADSAPDSVSLHIDNVPPVADAGDDQSVKGGAAVTLDATASSDADDDPLTYSWTQVEGLPVFLLAGDTSTASFTAQPGAGALRFEVTVSDGITTSPADSVWIHVDNTPPVAEVAQPEQQVAKGDTVVLDAQPSSDAEEDELTYQWTQIAGTEVELTTDEAVAEFTAPFIKDKLVFQLTVFDGLAWSAPITIVVHVENTPPVANASKEQVVKQGAEVTLSATASSDADGDSLSYVWTQIAGLDVELAGADTASPSFTAPEAKTSLIFEVIVNDGLTDSLPAQVIVHVSNIPPVADAGADQLGVEQGAVVLLNATESSDLDGDDLTYAWSQIEGPSVDLSDVSSPTPSFLAPFTKKTLVFELVVSDGTSFSKPDSVIVSTVNTAPIALAAGPETIDGGAEVQLDGTGSSDADGDELTYKWTQTAGESVLLSDANAASPTFTAPIQSQTLTFELTVYDGEVTSEVAEVSVSVNNHVPIADAGADQTYLGGELVTLDATASSDTDEDELTYQWTQTFGPEVELSDATSATPTFTIPVPHATYTFELVVSDGIAVSAAATVTLTVDNHTPEANAGADQAVDGGAVVTLAGSGSDADGDTVAYLWTQLSGPAVLLNNPAVASPSFVAPAIKGELVFKLVVDDGEAASAPSQVTISVNNNPPIANAGADQTAEGASLVALDGTQSTDMDGDSLVYAWSQTSGPAVSLSDASAAKPTFMAPLIKTTLSFDLVVSDGEDSSAPDSVVITVPNHVPVASAGPDQDVEGGTQVTLSGTATDLDDDALVYQWTQVSGPSVVISDATSAIATFTAPIAHSTLIFELVVSDDESSTAPDSVTVSIGNKIPVADAGADQAVDGGSVVTLDGSGTDADGDPLTYQWTQLSGAPVLLSDPTAAKPLFTAPATKGALVFKLTVDDGTVTSDESKVTITINNNAPAADAGDDQEVEGQSLVAMDASGSSDPDGDLLTYAWQQTSGPIVALSDSTAVKPTFLAPLQKAVLTFEVVVSDGEDSSPADSITITVANHAPSADAGDDQTVTGGDEVTLSGSGYDTDGDPLTYQWTQTSGPTVALADDTSPETIFTAPVPKGTLVFELATDDGSESSEPATVTVTIANHIPVADAGNDKTVKGDALVGLNGAASDLDNDPLTYQWTQVAGAPVLLDDPTSQTPTFKAPLVKDELVFKLVASDDEAPSADAFVSVFVANNAPMAEAGADQNVAGDSFVVLDGTASSDIDGDPLTYSWVQLDGPAVVLSDETAAKPTFQAPAFKSALTFELTVDDGEASSGADTVVVSVANNVPVADAGADQTVNDGETVTLDGSGSFDIDGDPLTWSWTQIAGEPVVLDDPTAESPTFTAPSQKDTLIFELTVCDDTVCSEIAKTTVLVANNPPVADAGADQLVDGGDTVFLNGTGSSDPDGDGLTYSWVQTGGTPVVLDDATLPNPSFSSPVPAQTLTFTLTVNDGSVDSTPDSVNVTIKNHTPVADAGPDQTVDGGAMVTLDASGSSDLDNDLLTYSWTQTSGTPVALSDPAAAKPSFNAPVPKETLTFSVTVDDGQVSSAPSAMSVTIKNHVPVVNAGPDQTVESDVLVTLDGGGSSDLDGDSLAYLWTQISGPPISLSDNTAVQPTFTAPSFKTSLVFELVIDDGEASSGADTVVIGVANNVPVADAGPDAQVNKDDVVTLNGLGSSDADGDPLTYLWVQTAGEAVVLSDATAAQPTFIAPAKAQTLRFELTVNDGTATSPADSADVIVGNLPPVADAGAAQAVDGGSTVTLDATASSDPNGDPLTYKWTQLTGDPVVLSDDESPTPNFTAPIPKQVLTFRVTVKDDSGDEDEADTTVTINNHVPVADAGPTQSIVGGTQVTLDGTASSDLDGDLLTYSWSQVSGTPVVLSDKNAAKPTFLSPVPRQDLVFELVVNDGEVTSPPSQVTISIQNNPPEADAGNDKCVPGGSWVSLNGAGSSDVDGDPLGFAWEQISGTPVFLWKADEVNPYFWAPTQKNSKLRFSLVVNDGFVDSAPDVVTVRTWPCD